MIHEIDFSLLPRCSDDASPTDGADIDDGDDIDDADDVDDDEADDDRGRLHHRERRVGKRRGNSLSRAKP